VEHVNVNESTASGCGFAWEKCPRQSLGRNAARFAVLDYVEYQGGLRRQIGAVSAQHALTAMRTRRQFFLA
jgi:hypothetical protein